ncbi:hypothetical protein, conserved [Leishmania tarentolae]|uniref:Uncharacterized protein n=1 Tax=Leishmania tarentolae TaxID=5689 RepID=A0A640KFZ4_LEITA|nr:hypothetical protein, conserved [Leishmania tarentolae]
MPCVAASPPNSVAASLEYAHVSTQQSSLSPRSPSPRYTLYHSTRFYKNFHCVLLPFPPKHTHKHTTTPKDSSSPSATMTALITKHRYNWMGYDGIESEEVDAALLRSDGGPANNYNYMHRQQVIMELKERLYRIKRDLGLISEEELRAEEEARQRRRMERKRRQEQERIRKEMEEAARAEEAERRRLEQEESEDWATTEEAEVRGKQECEKYMNDAEQCALLAAMSRTQKEIDSAITGFSKGTRILLTCSGNVYVSYLDGSEHFTIADLEKYNAANRKRVIKALAGTNVSVPASEEHSLEKVREAIQARDTARKKLDAVRALEDPTYRVRIRSTEKGTDGTPSQQVVQEDGDISALVANCEETKQFAKSVCSAYNKKAAASGRTLTSALCTHPVTAE